MYEIGSNGKKIYQYSLSSAWDLSTASYDSVSISAQDSAPSGLFFNPIKRIEIHAKDTYNDEEILEFNATITNSTETKKYEIDDGILIWEFGDQDLLNITIEAENYYEKEYTNYNITDGLEAELWNKINNVINFTDGHTGDPIENTTIEIERPDGSTIERTTNLTGQIQFDFQEDFNIIEGEYKITFEGKEGYISPITFTEIVNESQANIQQEYEIYRATININIFDRATDNLLTNPVNIILLEVFNITTTNGTYSYSNATLTTQTYTIQSISDGYDTEQLEFLYTGQENLTLNFYMLNLTDPSAGTLFVSIIDDFYRVIQNAEVSLLEYNSESNSYIKVSECRSNSNGECQFTIELNKKTYIVMAQAEINGVMNYANTNLGGEIIKTDNEVRNLVLRPLERFTEFPSQNLITSISETFENNISTIFVEYSTLDNTISEVCVEYFLVNTTRTSVYEQCVSSSSSYTATPILLDRNNNYEAEVYLYYNGIKYILARYEYPSVRSLQEILRTNNLVSPVVLFLWIVLIVFALKTENITIFIMGGLFLTWTETSIFPSVINVSGSVLKTVILIFMYYTSRKREDFQ
jgi:5-hydroxyisourate hydrolase-like protein (transthyretin family)